MLRRTSRSRRYTYDWQGESTVVKGTVLRGPGQKRQVKVPLPLGRCRCRRVTVVQISIESAVESLGRFAPILSPPLGAFRYSVPEWLLGSVVAVLSAGQRKKIGLDRASVQGAVVYAAGRNVYKVAFETRERGPCAGCREGYSSFSEGGGLSELAADIQQLYSGDAIPCCDGNVQTHGAGVHCGSGREEVERCQCGSLGRKAP